MNNNVMVKEKLTATRNCTELNVKNANEIGSTLSRTSCH